LDTGSGQSNIILEPPGGSIVIRSPTAEDDGVYQCFAQNNLGTAVTIKTTVRKAGLPSLLAVDNLNLIST